MVSKDEIPDPSESQKMVILGASLHQKPATIKSEIAIIRLLRKKPLLLASKEVLNKSFRDSFPLLNLLRLA
jgi:hypothetical protein